MASSQQGLSSRLSRLCPEKIILQDENGVSFDLDDVSMVSVQKGGRLLFVVSTKETYRVKVSMNRFLSLVDGHPAFVQTHRHCVVNLKKVRGVVSGEGGSFLLHFRDTDQKAPVSRSLSGRVAKALGVETLRHISPQSDYGRVLRAYGLITFGQEDASRLDKTDKKAVADFMVKWDIRHFSRYKMHRYFEEKTTGELDKTRIVRNLIWQAFCWISWGILPRIEGTIRTLWYQWISGVLYRWKLNSPNPENDQNMVYERLQDFVVLRLFSYRDFGFENPLDSWQVSDLNWHQIVFVEKQGMATFTRQLAESIGASWLASSGQVPWVTMEYMSAKLQEKLENDPRPIVIYSIVDFNPDGYDIQRNLLERLRFNDITDIESRIVITIDLFREEEIAHLRKPVASWIERAGKPPVPYTNKDKSKFREAMGWYYGDPIHDPENIWPGVNHPGLLSREPHPKGGEILTVHGLDGDILPRSVIRKRFQEMTEPAQVFKMADIVQFQPQEDDFTAAGTRSTFSANLREKRLKSRLTLEDLSSRSGVPVQILAAWESGTLDPTTNRLHSLAQAFGCNLEDLLRHV